MLGIKAILGILAPASNLRVTVKTCSLGEEWLAGRAGAE
ncbi:hypothetical protein A2U01_0070547, partial [Trifolium medium]|nr:hypothetical protein [Trifolium medium]